MCFDENVSSILKHSLHHVQYSLVLMQPDVMIGYGHLLERDFLGIFEEGVRAPDTFQPGDRQQSVPRRGVPKRHVAVGQPEAVVFPALCEEYVRRVRLKFRVRL